MERRYELETLRRSLAMLPVGAAALTREEALRCATIGGAYLTYDEEKKGSLEPGKLADFVVLDRSPLRTDPERITDIRVLATVLGGTPVYQSEPIFAG